MGSTRRLLLVDDDFRVRLAVADLLLDAGYEVDEAESGEAALPAIEAHGPPALVVTDIDLGAGMNGLEFAAVVARRWPSVAVLLISGLDRQQTGRLLGPSERFLPKPFMPNVLLASVGELTERASLG